MHWAGFELDFLELFLLIVSLPASVCPFLICCAAIFVVIVVLIRPLLELAKAELSMHVAAPSVYIALDVEGQDVVAPSRDFRNYRSIILRVVDLHLVNLDFCFARGCLAAFAIVFVSPAQSWCFLSPAENAPISRQYERVLLCEGDLHDEVLGAVGHF